MAYIRQIIKRNLKGILIGLVLIFIIALIFKNVGEAPYEDQHLMTTRLTLEFNHQNKEVRGFIYFSYWVKTSSEVTALPTSNMQKYLLKHAQIDLNPYREELISELKKYSIEEIKENWYSDYQFIQKRDVYFIKNDRRLGRFIKRQDFTIDLPYQIKKVFFVYLDKKSFQEYIKTNSNDNP